MLFVLLIDEGYGKYIDFLFHSTNSNLHYVLRAVTVLKEDEKYIVVGFRHFQWNVQYMKHAKTMSTITVELTIKVKQIHFLQCRKDPMDSSHHRCKIFTFCLVLLFYFGIVTAFQDCVAGPMPALRLGSLMRRLDSSVTTQLLQLIHFMHAFWSTWQNAKRRWMSWNRNSSPSVNKEFIRFQIYSYSLTGWYWTPGDTQNPTRKAAALEVCRGEGT